MIPKRPKVRHDMRSPTKALAFGLIASFAFAGCGDGTSGNLEVPSAGDLFGVATNLTLPEGFAFGLDPIDNIFQDRPLSIDDALVIAGGGRAAHDGTASSEFFVGRSEDRSVTKFRVGSAGDFEEVDRVSFANQAPAFIGPFFVFLDETKAYYFDRTQAQAIVWNPSTMEVRTTIDLSQATKAGFSNGYAISGGGGSIPVIGNRILLAVGWVNRDNREVVKSTGLFVIDTVSDTVEAYQEDSRCPIAIQVVPTPNGDTYFGTYEDILFDNSERMNEDRSGCVLRVNSGATEFDPAFQLNFTDVFEGRAAVNIYGIGQGSTVLTRVLDESVVPYTSFAEDLFNGNAWEWWTVDVAAGTRTQLQGYPLSPPFSLSFVVDGQAFTSISNEDFSATTMVTLDRNGPETVFETTGFVTDLFRLR